MPNKKNIVIKVKYQTPKPQSGENTLSAKKITEWNVKRIIIALGILVLTVSLFLYLTLSEPENANRAPDSLEIKAALDVGQNGPNAAVPSPNTATAAIEPKVATNRAESNQPLQFKLSEADKVISNQTITQIKNDIGSDATEIKNKDIAKGQPQPLKPKSIAKSRSNKVARALLASKIINKEPVGILKASIKVTKAKAVWINYFTELKGLNKKTVYHEWIYKGRIVYKRSIKIFADRWRASSRKLFNHTAEGQWRVRTVDEKDRVLDQQEFRIVLVR